MTERKHSKIGASSCERWWNCPGSIELAKDLPKPRTSFFAAEGTVAHEIGEFYLKANGRVDDHFAGTKQISDGHEIEVTDEMLEAVETYVDLVRQDIDKYDADYSDLRIEESFNLAHLDPEAYGSCDAVIHVPFNRLVVYDYKHGAGVPVEAVYNKQTLYYGLGAYRQLPKEEQDDLVYIETVIVQPRAPHRDGPVRRMTYKISDVLEWEKELYAAIRRVRIGFNHLESGTWCKFCPAKAVCPEIKNAVARQAQIDFSDEPHTLKPATDLLPEELGRVLEHAELIKDWISDVMGYAHKLAESGTDIPGYKLVSRRSNRKWADEKYAERILGKQYGDDIYTRKLKSPKQMELTIPKDEQDVLEGLIIKPDAGKTLAPVTDARDKLLPRAVADFIDIEL